MYIKIAPKQKVPSERWKVKQYSLRGLSSWIKSGGNIGWAVEPGYIVLDIDDMKACSKLGVLPYETYTVKTGGGGRHYYYKVEGIETQRFNDGNNHLADLQGLGTYVIAPPSIHPNGNLYEVVNPIEITELKPKDLEEVLGGLLGLPQSPKAPDRMLGTGKPAEFKVTDVWSTSGFVQQGNGDWLGPHPVHGSKTGHNLCMNAEQWVCFRCHEKGHVGGGGGAYEALAVDMGLVRCDQAGSGCLRGFKFIQLADEARKRGLV